MSIDTLQTAKGPVVDFTIEGQDEAVLEHRKTNEWLQRIYEKEQASFVIPAQPVQAKVSDSAVNSVNLQILQAGRVSPKMQIALDWFRDNPHRINDKSRDLEIEIGVSHMTIYKAQQAIKGE